MDEFEEWWSAKERPESFERACANLNRESYELAMAMMKLSAREAWTAAMRHRRKLPVVGEVTGDRAACLFYPGSAEILSEDAT